jgi:hypothetical protein
MIAPACDPPRPLVLQRAISAAPATQLQLL